MKTTEKNCESMTDILFTGRNTTYGAYEIRKKYEKYLIVSFILSTTAMLLGITVPLVASYYNNRYVYNNKEIISATFDAMKPPPANNPLPPPPPVDKQLEKQSRFLKPIITIDTMTDENFGRQDILNTFNNYRPVDTLEFTSDTAHTRHVIDEPKKEEPWTLVEEMPFFPGGEEERLKFLSKNIHYPETAKALGITGTVYIEFVVERTGDITGVTIKRGIGGGCDEEAARVVNLMKYIPGRQAGNTVAVRFTIPIKFLLRD
ncbi:MAG: energy transducer TonB [Bacteroidales bacterium]